MKFYLAKIEYPGGETAIWRLFANSYAEATSVLEERLGEQDTPLKMIALRETEAFEADRDTHPRVQAIEIDVGGNWPE